MKIKKDFFSQNVIDVSEGITYSNESENAVAPLGSSSKPIKSFVSFIKEEEYYEPKEFSSNASRPPKNEIKSNPPKYNFSDVIKYFDNSKISLQECKDIFSIDQEVKRILTERFNLIETINNKIQKLKWICENAEDLLERVEAKTEIFKLSKKIEIVSDKKQLLDYISKTSSLIEQYKQLSCVKTSFVMTGDNKNEVEKNQLRKQFLIFTKMFIQVDPIKETKRKISCDNCGKTDFTISEENLYTCLGCSACFQLPDESHSYKDIDRINLSARYTYTRKGHFKEAIDKFQCKQNTTIEKNVYNVLQMEFEKNGIFREKKQITKDLIKLFLGENGFSRHYEDIELIYCTITGEKPRDISTYENDLYIDFELQEKIYDEVKDPERTNSLNVNYKLLKLLERRGYKCKREDYYILKREKIAEHDEIWKRQCEKLGWVFIPTI